MKKETIEPPAIPNSHYEALLRMRERNLTAFRILSPNTRLAVLYYEAAKREHARLEAMKKEAVGEVKP